MNDNRRIDFQDLKARTRGSFDQVLAHYGIVPVGSGDQVRIHCPFHDDQHPSTSINRAEGVWKCHAGCGDGTVLEFVHRMETRDGAVISIRAAGLKLAAICGIEPKGRAKGQGNGSETRQEARRAAPAKEPAQSTSQGSNARLGASQAERGAIAETNRPQNKPLSFALTLDLDAGMPYLNARGMSRAVAAEFGLGLCTTGKTIPGRLGIPIHNATGELIAYAGRWVGPDDEIPEDKGKYQLPAQFHKTAALFNLHRVKECQTLTIVEGFFGAIRLYGSMRPRIPAVALMGSSMSETQVSLLLAHCPTLRFVTVCLDSDDAGRKASELVAAQLARHWWVRVAMLPAGMQPDTAPEEALLDALGRKH